MSPRYDVLVVGAGAVGLSVARALAREGAGRIAILDRNDGPGQGSTGRAAGGMRAQWSTPANIELSRFTIDGYAQLKRETGGLQSFVQPGYLFLAGSEKSASYLERAHAVQRSCGLDVELLSPAQALAVTPFVRAEGLHMASFRAADALFDPHEIATLLYRDARALGVETHFGREVRAIAETATGFAVDAGDERLESRWLVNAAGPFAAEVGRMLDVEVPVVPYRRNAAVTEAIDGLPPLIPMCVDLDTRLLTRREGPGCAIMFSNPDDPPSTSTAFDFDYLAQIAGRVGNRFPFLETAAIDTRKCWAGLYPETADRHAIIGPTPGHPRFLQCAGFCGHGVMQSLAAGQAIAELVTRGRCHTFDLRPLRLERFAEGDLTLELATL